MSKIIDDESGYSRKQDEPEDLLAGFSPKPKETNDSKKDSKEDSKATIGESSQTSL